jgi:aspartyl-tRNA(Asn)/glutamyl-tRNA(Gln) amidotransferase subunit C
VRVFFSAIFALVKEEDPHPTLSREGGRGQKRIVRLPNPLPPPKFVRTPFANPHPTLKHPATDASAQPMTVDLATVKKIAGLARLAVTDGEAEALLPELNAILGFVDKLGEADVTGVEPMTAVIPNHLRLRADAVTDGNVRDRVLANAPQAEHGFFAVPKVIE